MSTRSQSLSTILCLLAWAPLCLNADFSNAQLTLHPRYPGSGPFILEIAGTWPSDCHPGEQKPIVESFDGLTLELGFEIIVLHVTCNGVDTPYRVLADLSSAVRDIKPSGERLDLRVDFQGAMLHRTLDLRCPRGQDCAKQQSSIRRPEEGFYHHPGLPNLGLLAARQNAAMALVPLAYDQAGSSEWLFSGSVMREDTFFTEVLRPAGGDCFGCEPSGAAPTLTHAGYLSVLVDRPDRLLVKYNDGMFTEWTTLVYGFQTFKVGAQGERTVVDLTGRWGLSENRGTDPPLGDLTEFFPGVFDIELQDIITAEDGIAPSGEVSYLVRTPTGGELGQLVCSGEVDPVAGTDVCAFIDPTDAAEPLFLFRQDGPSSLTIEYGRAVIAIGTPPGGRAVRLD